MSNISKRAFYASCFSLSTLNFTVNAGDLAFKSEVESTAYKYETKRGEELEYDSNDAIVIIPSLLSTYTSKVLIASLLAEHTVVEQDRDIDGADKKFTELQYNGMLTLIPNSMSLGFNGSKNYRVINQLENDFNDKVLSPGELTQYTTNSANFSFVTPNPKYIGLSFQAAHSQSKSEESFDINNGIDTKSTSSSINLFQGHRLQGYSFNLSAQNSRSQRSSLSDFQSTNLNGRLGLALGGNIELILVGSIDEYDVDGSSIGGRNNIDSNSYGAGFEWTPRQGRKIGLTYNQIEELSGKTKFVGLNTNWSFSSRTNITLDISKRFYGDAYNFSLSQNLKNFRLSANYNESVTSYATYDLVSSPQSFVCDLGATDLADCFIPDSTDYELQPGEGFLDLELFETNITEEVFLQKSGSINISYDKRRVKASINATYGKTEYLESNREYANRRIGFQFSYQLGKRTTAGLTSGVSRRESFGSEKADTTKTVETYFDRDLNQKTTLKLALKVVDRESVEISRNITDRRLTLGLNYTF